MRQPPVDFVEFLSLLNDHHVRYLIIGELAVIYHGYDRVTGDMDVWVAICPANASALVDALREFGFEDPNLVPELFLRERQIVRMGVVPMRIAVTTTIDGVTFDECFADRVVCSFGGIDVPFISLDHLKRNKAASARLKDLADLDNLP
jgi:hypothetical protein